MRTLQYIYSLGNEELLNEPFIAWHWHPDVRTECHVHVYAEVPGLGPLGDFHIPTRRVSFEEVLRFAIRDLGVKASPGWESALSQSEGLFDEHKSWHGSSKPPEAD